MKKILITGANSYIGTSFEDYISKLDDYQVDTVDMMDNLWKEQDFSSYDVVFHVAGIAHIKEIPEIESLYYEVNRDLVIDVAKKAKNSGVKQFVFLSSMSVYGLTSGIITPNTVPNPNTYYGKSKLQAEAGLQLLRDDSFKISVLRPPMVYGKNCKGNFQSLIKIAKKASFFPYVNNQRSMIYIDNLSSFVKKAIDEDLDGIFFPQNKEYVNTSNLEKLIANSMNKKMIIVKSTYPLIMLLRKFIVQADKAFGTLIYKDTEQFDFSYNVVNFEETIRKSV